MRRAISHTLLLVLSLAPACTDSHDVVVSARLALERSVQAPGRLGVVVTVGDSTQSALLAPGETEVRLDFTDLRVGERTFEVTVTGEDIWSHGPALPLLEASKSWDLTEGVNQIWIEPQDFEPYGDHDNDGVVSWLEYNAGCNPAAASPACTWIRISTRSQHSCAIDVQHRLACWGRNDDGQLGVSGESTSEPGQYVGVPLGADGWEEVAVGDRHTCAIDTSERLWCWGANWTGQLGLGHQDETTGPSQETLHRQWRSVCAGEEFTCGIAVDGTLSCWGSNATGVAGIDPASEEFRNEATSVTTDTNWTDLSCGAHHVCGVRGTGQLFCWGADHEGQLNDDLPDPNPHWSPISIHGAWARVFAGTQHTCALQVVGALRCWGANETGQTGNPALDNPAAFDLSSLASWTAAAGGEGHTCAITGGHELYCWGAAGQGRLGRGPASGVVGPASGRVGVEADWITVSAGRMHTCGLRNGQLYCWGSNGVGAAGLGVTAIRYTQETVAHGTGVAWEIVSSGYQHTCAIDANGTLYCWGDNETGALGDGTTVAKPSPTLIDDTVEWTAVAAGHTHTCGLTTSGLFCWGDGGSGQLGNGPAGLQLEPKEVSAPTPGGHWTAVAVGAAHTCALQSENSDVTLWCWGSSEFSANGGDPGGEDVEAPVKVGTDTDWSSITAGDWHTCGRRGTQLYCWGRDEAGQVGDGNGADPYVSSPTLVGTGPWASVAAGSQHTCAIDDTNALHCWGSDDSAQLGNGNTTPNQVSPVDVSGTWSTVSAGGSHTCALQGNVRSCWGSNDVGQLGVGEATAFLDEPSELTTGPWTDLSAGDSHTCAIDDSGWLYCWGNNAFGQLGVGTPWADVPMAVQPPS